MSKRHVYDNRIEVTFGSEVEKRFDHERTQLTQSVDDKITYHLPYLVVTI